MKFSVVTISFNQRAYLQACIESVLTQDHPDVQYIVVDPGSTDGSRELIQGYGSRIETVFQKDRGPADGLNMGFAKAKGEIFCYLNSDDTFEPGALATMAKNFARSPQADVVIGNGYIVDHAGRVLRRVYSDPFSLLFAAYDSCIAVQPSTFFRRSAFESVGGFNTENRSNWDDELLIDMVLHGARVLQIEDFLSCYRIHKDSITGAAKMREQHQQYRERVFEKIRGRARRPVDRPLAAVLRLLKHIRKPAALIERLRHGPVFGAARD